MYDTKSRANFLCDRCIEGSEVLLTTHHDHPFRRKEVASESLWPMESPPRPLSLLNGSVSNLAQRLLGIPYFNIYYLSGHHNAM